MWSKITGTIALTLISFNTMALPVLTESEDGSGLLATIYPDHENPNKVYFFPNTGGLEKDENGVPRFGMTYWTPEEGSTTGGYFSGIFRLGISKDLKEAVNAQLKNKKSVAVVPVQESHIFFMQDAVGERVQTEFYKEINMPPFGGRAEDSIGISATLTKMGSRALATVLNSGGNAGDLKYCYKIQGVSPVFKAWIDLNYHKIYEHFVTKFGGSFLFVSWSIRTEIQSLYENGVIKIQITGGDAKHFDYIMKLAEELTTKFMVPVLDNRQGSTTGMFHLSYSSTHEDRNLHYELIQREFVTRDYCVALGMGELKSFPWLITKTEMN